jgi:hypothetical protein
LAENLEQVLERKRERVEVRKRNTKTLRPVHSLMRRSGWDLLRKCLLGDYEEAKSSTKWYFEQEKREKV